MVHRVGTLILLVLFGYAGVWLADHWSEVRIAMGIDAPPDRTAVSLARHDHTLSPHISNEGAIADLLQGMVDHEGATVEPGEWRAQQERGWLFVVSYVYHRDGVEQAYHFEVDVDAESVRVIRPGTDLAERYGLTATAPR